LSKNYSAGYFAVKFLESKLKESGKDMLDLMAEIKSGASLDQAVYD
jgi:hypothetical protein